MVLFLDCKKKYCNTYISLLFDYVLMYLSYHTTNKANQMKSKTKPIELLIAPGSAKVVAISLSFQSSTLLFINLSISLVIVLLLMLPLLGMLFQMRFVPLHPWRLSESSLKPTCTPKHIHLSLDHPLVFSEVLEPSSVSGILKFGLLLFCFVAP